MFLNPAKYATVIGKSDNEQGPKLVNSPPKKTIRSVIGLGLFRPLLINCKLFRDRSEKIKFIVEMSNKRFTTLKLPYIYYLVKNLL